MGRYENILVAVDGSLSSTHALQESFKLKAKRTTVVSAMPQYEGDLDFVAFGDALGAVKKRCEKAISDAAELARENKMKVETVCIEGDPTEKIIEMAAEKDCDLIVVGRRGLHRLERVLVGSTASRVIGSRHKDVLVVPRDISLSLGKVLVAVDGSKYSRTASRKAIEFAKSYGGELKVVSVADVPPEFYGEAPDASDKMVEKALGYVKDVEAAAKKAGIETEVFVKMGEAYEKIVELAKEQGVELIIMGSRGRTGLKRLLMGSVTERVIGYTHCPVLVVKE